MHHHHVARARPTGMETPSYHSDSLIAVVLARSLSKRASPTTLMWPLSVTRGGASSYYVLIVPAAINRMNECSPCVLQRDGHVTTCARNSRRAHKSARPSGTDGGQGCDICVCL